MDEKDQSNREERHWRPSISAMMTEGNYNEVDI